MEPTPDQWRSWLDALDRRLSSDDDFRRTFLTTPGKAVSTLGVPNELIASLIALVARPGYEHEAPGTTYLNGRRTLARSDAPTDQRGIPPAEPRRWSNVDDDVDDDHVLGP